MNIKNIFKNRYLSDQYGIHYIVFFSAFLLRLYNMNNLLEHEKHAFRQTFTAITVQSYFRDGYSLFHYQVPIFGAPWEVIIECPIYQSIVYFTMRLFHGTNIDWWCKLVSIIIFMISAVFLWLLISHIAGEYVANIAGIFYLFSPYMLYWSRAALIDYTSVLFALIYAYFFLKWLAERKTSYFAVSMIFGILAYLQKTTTMFGFVCFLGFYILIWFFREIKADGFKAYVAKNIKMLIMLVLLCIIPAFFGALWTHYADMQKASHPLTQWLTSSEMSEWNFGSLEMRFIPKTWRIISEQILGFGGGVILSVIMAILALIIIWKEKKQRTVFFVACACIAVPLLVITNLFYAHTYYYIALTPFISMFYGVVFGGLISFGKRHLPAHWIAPVILLFVISPGIIVNKGEFVRAFTAPFNDFNTGKFLNWLTSEDEPVVIVGHDWDPTILYSADRKGLMVRDDTVDIAAVNSEIRDGSYRYILCSLAFTNNAYMNDILNEYPLFVQYQNYYPDTGRLYEMIKDEAAASELQKSLSKEYRADKEGTFHDLNYAGQYLSFKRSSTEGNAFIRMHFALENGSFFEDEVYFPEGCDTAIYKSYESECRIMEITPVTPDSGIIAVSTL